MNPSTIALLSCPSCRSALQSGQVCSSSEQVVQLHCSGCGEVYSDEGGILRFVAQQEIENTYPEIATQARAAARFYDFVSVQQFLEIIGIGVDEARQQYLGRLEIAPGARVLDIGAGTGAEMIHLAKQTPDLQLHGLDLSIDMLRQCQRKLKKAGMAAELYVGLAERLPFKDSTFDVVFHMGAFNEFRDKPAAVAEMIRVARPDTRIMVADEWLTSENTQTGVGRRLREMYPSMTLDAEPPVDLIPPDMLQTQMTVILKGFGYCVDFRKPA